MDKQLEDKPSDKPMRILLKLSGEALMGELEFGINPEILAQTAAEIAMQQAKGTQIGLVIGGGNIFRGAGLVKSGIEKVSADQMGMLATVMNALAMQDTIEQLGVSCKVMTALAIDQLGESFSAHRARAHLSDGSIVICAAGTGSPFFTTDTAASLRAVELEADLLLKATKVDGIYDADPMKHPDAQRYDSLSFDSAIQQQLGVMDLTAMVMCRDNNLPLRVFDMFAAGALRSIVRGDSVGTLVTV